MQPARAVPDDSSSQPEVSRNIASLAVAWLEGGERLNVRQREELRRNLSVAGELLDWRILGSSALETAGKDTLRLARNGLRALGRDLAAELAAKKAEPAELRSALRDVLRRAKRHDFAEPLEFTYSHTARQQPRGLVTKTETLELTDFDEVEKAVADIEGRLETWTRLQMEMLEGLRDDDQRLADTRRRLPAFVASSESLLRHVLATMR